MKSLFWEVSEFLQQDDAVTTSSSGWLGNEGLAGVLTKMMFEVSNFIRQQEGVRHEFVI